LRANIYTTPPSLEINACFPVNTWYGLGLGGDNMYNSELVFLMAPVDETLRKVISTRT
jgi:hypothetical protein